MERKEIEARVNEFLIEEMEIEPENIRDDARLKEDVGLDSLDYVDIVVIVEKTFGFKVKPEEMAGTRTLKAFYDYIESKAR
jgi:acyl carrier protein